MPQKSCQQTFEGCVGKADLWTKVVQCGQKLSKYGQAVQDNLNGPKIWSLNVAIKIIFFGTLCITSELFVFFPFVHGWQGVGAIQHESAIVGDKSGQLAQQHILYFVFQIDMKTFQMTWWWSFLE